MLNGHLITSKTTTFNLGQTDFADKTPTTSNQTLKLPVTTYTTTASTSATFFKIGEAFDGTIIDTAAHDYVVFASWVINFNYGSNNVSNTIHGIRNAGAKDYQYGLNNYTINSTTGTGTPGSKSGSYITSPSILLYQKADNTYAATTNTYGVFGSTPGIASISSNVISLQFSSLTIRYSDTYFPLAALQAIDPANTTITIN
jgi:hypothetical protein